jgi:DNA polymerase-3 subunit delta'
MPLHPFFGHSALRRGLGQAVASGRLPQVLLLVGEPGVGKQRLALWLAQLTLCGEPGTEPCGRCRACRLVLGLVHPDLHWFVPIPRPKATDPEKQIDEARDTIAEMIAARREKAAYGPTDGMAMHGVAMARLLLRTVALTPVEGARRVVIVGEADRLVPQEASPEAANALLKFLEEPPASTLVILTTTDATRVLPTIRSRAVPVRVGRLSDAELEEGLAVLLPQAGAAERRERIARARGSLGRALAPDDDSMAAAVDALLEATKAGPSARYERVLQQAPWSARGDFTALLDRLAASLGAAARGKADPAGPIAVPAALAEVGTADRVLAALDKVDEARDAARGNVNPQLLLARLSEDLAEALWR